MIDKTSLALIKSIINIQKDLIVLFDGEEPILTNQAFNKFCGVSSFKEYKENFGPFINNFVPHPSYFNEQKIESGDDWFNAIMKLPEIERVVSMVTQNYEPHAFSVHVDKSVEQYIVVIFTDITQSLIKRIMIENHANMDIRSGAYDKKYFLQVAQSYQDAAIFNEKIFGAILIKAGKDDNSNIGNDEKILSSLVDHFKSITRQDDMLVRWSDDSFLLIYLVDDESNAQMILKKLEILASKEHVKGIEYSFTLTVQEDKESIKRFIKRVDG